MGSTKVLLVRNGLQQHTVCVALSGEGLERARSVLGSRGHSIRNCGLCFYFAELPRKVLVFNDAETTTGEKRGQFGQFS